MFKIIWNINIVTYVWLYVYKHVSFFLLKIEGAVFHLLS